MLCGKGNHIELKRSLDLVETSGEMIKNIVNHSNSLSGYLKYSNLADDKELKEIHRQPFFILSDYLGL